MSKRLTLLTVVAVSALALIMPASKAFAASSDTVSITVTISATVSVEVTESSYDFGSLSVGAEVVSANSLTLTNDGSGIDETYSLSCSNTADWTVDLTPGTDAFVLSALFNLEQPSAGDFRESDALITAPVPASSPEPFNYGEAGNSVPVGEARHLWLKLQTPTETAATAQQTITLTVTAEAS